MLAELGPGRGTLMADMLRAALIKPDFLRAADIHLVEISPRLREVQRATLGKTGLRAPLAHAPRRRARRAPAIFIANEFFDALPVRQFQWRDGSWSERMVGLTDDGALGFGLRPVDQRAAGVPLPEGAVVEASPAGKAAVAVDRRAAEAPTAARR